MQAAVGEGQMRTLLLGGTDLTLAIAQQMCRIGLPPAGVVHVGRQFGISYRPAGVTNVRFSDMAAWCDAERIPHQIYQSSDGIEKFAKDIGADFCLAAGWYHMVAKKLRAVFPLGAAGLHASLLPKFRGGAPLNWAILAGEKEAGISLFVLGDGVDDGFLYGQERFPIGPRTTIGELVQAAEHSALKLIETYLPAISDRRSNPQPQVGKPTYCLQRSPEDGAIDWSKPASEIDRLVRAVGRPYPGAYSWFESRKVCIWTAEPMADPVQVSGARGQIARIPEAGDPIVVTGDGNLVIHEATDETGADVMLELRKASNKRFRDRRVPSPGASDT